MDRNFTPTARPNHKPLMRRKFYPVTLHARNIATVADPLWEMWLDPNPTSIQMKCAQTPRQAIAFKVAVERKVWELNHTKHVDDRLRPVACKFRFSFEVHQAAA